ncbi:trihelix transcription factor ENAP1 isoform X2 [Musa acuminata AAA Group]|uniref:trihelix transcription factor ENAP1 isoform X2 n=1 Tax=Musa acuminata AAA Group TaxID=214697 RepID=UPI0031D46048
MEGRETPPTRPPNPALPYREDCWSEGETSTLVDAWGDRYLELKRGNLRQKHWQEVADAVNCRRGAFGRRPPRTDVQCKNRIDTLKKKYKIEKARVTSAFASQWQFFSRLDALIGSAAAPPAKKPSPLPPLAVPLPYHRKGSTLPFAAAAAVRPVDPRERRGAAISISVDDSIFQRAAAAAAAAGDDNGEEDDLESPSGSSSRSGGGLRMARGKEGDGIRELAKAIERFAEIYERVEGAKQRQMMEMEKKRMEFAKELEFQRMQIFVDSQVQLAKIKRAKRSDADGYM